MSVNAIGSSSSPAYAVVEAICDAFAAVIRKVCECFKGCFNCCRHSVDDVDSGSFIGRQYRFTTDTTELGKITAGFEELTGKQGYYYYNDTCDVG